MANAQIYVNTRCAICLSGKAVFFVGKGCIFLCGENPYKFVDYCREGMYPCVGGSLTHVNIIMHGNRLSGHNDANWLDVS